MPVVGTEKENIVEAVPVHVECTGRPMIGRMQYDRDAGVVYCVVEG
jgi:hypothetical protein